MKLSEHLDLSEFTRSYSEKRKGISNMPTPEHIENFKKLAENIFEPIRKHFGVPILISSGYRSKELNKSIGGATTSQHLLGQALDRDMDGTPNGVTNKMVFDYIKANLNFDQLINEFDYSWVHVSYNPTGKQRKQILNAVKVGGKTSYAPHK